jgi:hypothetical protein
MFVLPLGPARLLQQEFFMTLKPVPNAVIEETLDPIHMTSAFDAGFTT